MRLQTCGDHTESYLSDCAMNIRWIFDLASVRAIVGELDLLKCDGGISTHDITSPDNTFPENTIKRRVWSLLIMEYLKKELDG